MRKEISIGQLLSIATTLLIAMVTGWITINNRVIAHDAEIKALQHEQVQQGQKLDKIEEKANKIDDKVNQILLILQNKADRK